jgi:hypothetical protein
MVVTVFTTPYIPVVSKLDEPDLTPIKANISGA